MYEGTITRRMKATKSSIYKNMLTRNDLDCEIAKLEEAQPSRIPSVCAKICEMFGALGILCKPGQDVSYYRELAEKSELPEFRDVERSILNIMYENFENYPTPEKYMLRIVDHLSDPADGWQGNTLRLRILRQFIEVIRERIMDINPMANVVCINSYLDDRITDDEFSYMTGLEKCRKSDTLICGCTDNFYAQDRCAQLSVKYGIPYLAAQIFAGGNGHEVIFYYPGVTQSCPRCMLESRYRKELTSSHSSGTGSSAGTAVCVTDYLNAIKSQVAINILCYSEKSTKYYHALDKLADRNYLMTKCSDSLKAPAFKSLDTLAVQETDLSFPYATIAIGQTPEQDCPLCGGQGRPELMEGKITDTRRIPNRYSA